ncbi:MAG: EamA family transporter, partial [Paracoccaceae bacterium]
MTPSPPLSALPPRGLFAAALWMCGAIASFSAMAVSARMIGDRHDTFEILAYRSLLGVALVLAVVATTGQTARLGTRRLGAHAFRNTVHFTGQALWFFA